MYNFQFILFITVSVYTLHSVYGIIGYDCSAQETNITRISLTKIGVCDNARQNITSENKKIKLVQLRDIDSTEVFSCLVELIHHYNRCGPTLDTFYGIVLSTEIIRLTRKDCILLVRTGKVDFAPYGYKLGMEGLMSNYPNTQVSITRGSNQDGSCTEGDPLTVRGIYMDKPYVVTNFKVLYKTTNAFVDLTNGQMELRDGQICQFTSGECFSPTLGNCFWDTQVEGQICNKERPLSVLYTGKAVYTKEITDNEVIKMYTYTAGESEFAITVSGKKKFCNLITVVMSEHPRLLIIEEEEWDSLGTVTTMKDKEVDLSTFVNTKLIFMLNHIRKENNDFAEKVARDRCLDRAEGIRTSIGLAYGSPNHFAYNYYKGPGYTGKLAGDTIFMVKCKPVSVYHKGVQNKCYQELPVVYDNKTMFLQPRTKLLSHVGTETECNSLFPITWEIDGNWFAGGSESLIPIEEPQLLQPDVPERWHFTMPKGFLKAGTYSQDALSDFRRTLMMPDSTNAAMNNIARNSLTWDNNGRLVSSVANSFSEEDLSTLQNRMGNFLINAFRWLESFGSFCAGFWVIWCLFKMLVELFLNINIIRLTGRPKIDYLLSPWARVFDYVENRRVVKANRQNANTDAEMGDLCG
ncbi:glycoprotein [Drosophila unispina virus 1]|uniref:Glycoprotein n=1 Tax=Drosophila unispina virus 1 TaxID=1802951 RepID=A0A140D8N5_9MONO|nr:glycoprotein [Drosophila unispina virus 1]AMK09259.1 glycoprotein [Drosophila unispina virus 1]